MENDGKDDLPVADAGEQDGGQAETSSASNTENQQKSSMKDKVSKGVQSFLKKGGAAKQSLLAAIGPILMYIFAGIVILIIAIGLIMFFVTMPGMVMEKIKALAKEIGNGWNSWWGQDSAEQVEDEQIYGVLDYLEQMGYDLKGDGFLTEYVGDDESGVEKDENDMISNAKSDFIYYYLVSENYLYTIKNFNTDTDGNAWYAFWDHVSALVSDSLKNRSGMLGFYHDNGSEIGSTSDNAYDAWERGSIDVDVESKTLSIKKGWTNGAMTYNLDGWTGRYGMPIDFLISVQLATLMPDLAYDMFNSFQTEIRILLHDTSGEVKGAYKTAGGGYIEYDELNKALNFFEGRNLLTRAITSLDNLGLNPEEAQAAFDLGIVPSFHNPPDCGCEVSETKVYVDGDKKYILYATADNEKDKGEYYYNSYSADSWETATKKYVKADDEHIQTSTQITKVGDNCKSFVKKVIEIMNANTEYSYETYVPYIENVTDHWYRDVYFITNKDVNDFVDYDYEYEAMMKERWTLYETYTYEENQEKAGEYKLYAINSNGDYATSESEIENYDSSKFEKSGSYYLFKGTQNEANEAKVKVSKKAEMVGMDSVYEDLGWVELGDGVYSAYDMDEGNTEEYQKAFKEEELEEIEDEIEKEAKKNIYILVKIGNVTQTGEGQRTETNSKIKKMFLQNRYFRYDGSAETAEIITKLRNEHNIEYGPLDENDLGKTTTMTKNDKTETYTVKDYSANVTLNQDSLNAFSMLENTHTLDADYIYRDFKELIVELGYFTKEELTDETPRLLQFLVPDIGSGGYPNRVIDKREQEFGTMIHSKGDIEANNKHTLVALYEKISQMKEENPEQGNVPKKEHVSGISSTNNSQNLSQVSGVQQNSNTENDNILSSNKSNVNLKNVKGTTPSFILERAEESGDGYESVVKSGNVKYIHRYQGGQSYSDITFTWAGQTKTLGRAACGLFSCFNVLTGYGYEFDPAKDLPGFNWGATMDAVKTLMDEKGVPGQFIDYTDTAALDEALNEGRPAILLVQSTTDKQGVTWTSGGHFIALVGKDADGNILTLDSAAQGNVKRHDYPGTVEDMLPAFQHDSIWIADEPPTGMNKGEVAPYEGYEGNEAVVSPVTGILLEYDTYTDEDIDSVSGEEYRTNVDLKYGPATAIQGAEGETEEGGESEPKPEPEPKPGDEGTPEGSETEGGEIVADKVGYAKILVLDAENYQKLESLTSNRWKSDSLVRISEAKTSTNNEAALETEKSSARYIEKLEKEEQMDEDHEDWDNLDKTIYGYKEFAENYEKYGIAGQIIYIDGFKCEMPDEKLSGEKEESGETEGEESGGAEEGDIADQIPEGEKLTIDSFKKVTESTLKSTEKPEEDAILQSKYEKEDEYKLASKKATEKLNAEATVKNEANSSIYLPGEDLIFIKEGTVIGRTMTDREVVEKVRKDPPHPYEYYRPESSEGKKEPEEGEKTEENEDKLIGNYIRIIMRDLDDTVVENVEDYMKLDEAGDDFNAVDQEYKAWPGDLEVLAEVIYHEAGYSYLAALSNKFATDQKEADFEMQCMGYSVVNKLLEQNKQWYGMYYDESRTDMSPLVQVTTNQKYRWYGGQTGPEALKVHNGGKGCYTEKELEYAEYCLKYDCTSVKKPYATPLGIDDGYTATEAGTVIPRAMCQQGGYGDGASGQSGIILVGFWDHDNNNLFGKGDELWGVDRSMEHLIDN